LNQAYFQGSLPLSFLKPEASRIRHFTLLSLLGTVVVQQQLPSLWPMRIMDYASKGYTAQKDAKGYQEGA
jgi:hypothetical protein